MHKHKLNLARQIKIEESLLPRIDNNEIMPDYAHFLATHPKEYLEFKESDEDLRRTEIIY